MEKSFFRKNSKHFLFLLFFIIFSSMIYFNTFSSVRNNIQDSLYENLRPLDNIIIVKIDDSSINQIGRWPWNRSIYVDVLDKLKGAKVVGLDISFFEPSKDDEFLRSKLSSMDNIVLASEYNAGTLYTPVFNTSSGYVNFITDSDGITRKLYPLLIQDEKPFAYKIYDVAYNKNSKLNSEFKYINFAGEPYSFDSISVIEVLNNDYDFNGKIVFIGATAPNLHDNYFVPTSNGIPMPGVEIHANTLQNLILNNFIKFQSSLSIFIVFTLLSILCYYYLPKFKVFNVSIGVFIALIFYILISIKLFSSFNYIIDLFYFPIAMIVFTSLGVGYNYYLEKINNQFITGAFGKYISKDLLKLIINRKDKLKLGGERRLVTIFFSDIRGFTSISESLSPEKLVKVLNEYLDAMTKVILDHNGTVDKFIGDAIMAIWNAPLDEKDHALLGCKAAIAQVKLLNELRPKWIEEGYPAIKIGSGLNTGNAVIGNIGGSERFDYTAIGDSVNLASRLEGLTKQYGVDIIISESTYQFVKDQMKTRLLDAVKVKGKKIPVKIYELCIHKNSEFNKMFEKALNMYFDYKFSNAKELFKKAMLLNVKDKSCSLFIERCDFYIKRPPSKNWDGSYTMKTK